MIFTYWQGDQALISPMIADWASSVCEPRVFGDIEAEAALGDIDPEWIGIFRRISIPSCRSDIARLALLYKFGGLYVDAHTGRPNLKRLCELLGRMTDVELCVAIWPSARTSSIPFHVANGAILARRQSDVVVGILSALVDNLRCHMAAQDRGGGKVYNIAALTGGWAIRMLLFRRDIQDLDLLPHFKGRISKLFMNSEAEQPFEFYAHYGYRKDDQHWSERQNVEPLFSPAQPEFQAPSDGGT